jgi:hypothetical protein
MGANRGARVSARVGRLRLKNIGSDPVFPDCQVAKAQRGITNRVATREEAPGDTC